MQNIQVLICSQYIAGIGVNFLLIKQILRGQKVFAKFG